MPVDLHTDLVLGFVQLEQRVLLESQDGVFPLMLLGKPRSLQRGHEHALLTGQDLPSSIGIDILYIQVPSIG